MAARKYLQTRGTDAFGLEVCVAGPEADNGFARTDNPINDPRNAARNFLMNSTTDSVYFIIYAA